MPGTLEAFVRPFAHSEITSQVTLRPRAVPVEVTPIAFIRWGKPSKFLDDPRVALQDPTVPIQVRSSSQIYYEEARKWTNFSISDPEDDSNSLIVQKIDELAFTAPTIPGVLTPNVPARSETKVLPSQLQFSFSNHYDELGGPTHQNSRGEDFQPIVLDPFTTIVDVQWSRDLLLMIYVQGYPTSSLNAGVLVDTDNPDIVLRTFDDDGNDDFTITLSGVDIPTPEGKEEMLDDLNDGNANDHDASISHAVVVGTHTESVFGTFSGQDWYWYPRNPTLTEGEEIWSKGPGPVHPDVPTLTDGEHTWDWKAWPSPDQFPGERSYSYAAQQIDICIPPSEPPSPGTPPTFDSNGNQTAPGTHWQFKEYSPILDLFGNSCNYEAKWVLVTEAWTEKVDTPFGWKVLMVNLGRIQRELSLANFSIEVYAKMSEWEPPEGGTAPPSSSRVRAALYRGAHAKDALETIRNFAVDDEGETSRDFVWDQLLPSDGFVSQQTADVNIGEDFLQIATVVVTPALPEGYQVNPS